MTDSTPAGTGLPSPRPSPENIPAESPEDWDLCYPGVRYAMEALTRRRPGTPAAGEPDEEPDEELDTC